MSIKNLLLLVGLTFLGLSSVCGQSANVSAPDATSPHYTYVIVHGAWGGGWAFKEVERLLRADGHNVYRPTLTGQGEKVHLASPNIGLDTHVTDIVNVILFENLHDIVLVGHSYGGMVISGVMQKVPDRIKYVFYLDAVVPNDGESFNTAFGPTHSLGKVEDGFIKPTWVKPDQPLPHDVPHPAKTVTDTLAINNPAAAKLPVTYILTVDPGKKPEEDTFYPFYVRAQQRGWKAITMEGDHNVQWSHPKELVHLIEQVPAASVSH